MICGMGLDCGRIDIFYSCLGGCAKQDVKHESSCSIGRPIIKVIRNIFPKESIYRSRHQESEEYVVFGPFDSIFVY